MKKFLITLIILAFVVGAAVGGAYFYRSSRKNSNPVKVYPVSGFVGNWYDSSQSFSGNVVVNEEQNIFIQQDKIIKEIYASPGDSVKVGDVILEYDSTQESLRLDTMYAQLDVTRTNLRLAENQLVKLNNTTPIEDDEEPPKTEAEKKLEEAEKAYEEATDKTIAPYTEYNDAKQQVTQLSNEMADKEKEYNNAAKEKGEAYKALNAFYKKYNIATFTDASPNPIPKTKEEIDKQVDAFDKNVVREYGGYYQVFETKNNTFAEKQKALSEVSEKYNNAIINCANKEKAYNQAEEAVTLAEEEVKKAEEAVAKEQEEELENPTIVYTKSDLLKAIRLKKEEIRDLSLSIEKQDLAIRKQEKVIEKCKVVSELDGIVRFNEITDDVYSGITPAIVIDASGIYSAVVNVDELSLEDIYIGQEVSVLSYDNGGTYTGKISKISENPVDGSGGYYDYTASSYPVTVAIDNADDLQEGMWVEVSTSETANYETLQNEIVLPLALCKKENSSYYVMKQSNGRLKKQYISTGKIYYGEQIVVKSGITASDYIAFPYEKDAVEGKVCKEGDLSDMYGY